jgi:hypothetical protein
VHNLVGDASIKCPRIIELEPTSSKSIVNYNKISSLRDKP